MYLICGEALYDVFVDPLDADVRRRVSLTAKPGGSPFNVAIGLARLGVPVALATEIADDTLGRNLEARLRAEGVRCDFLRRTASSTPLAMVEIDAQGAPRYAFHGLAALQFHPDQSTFQEHLGALNGIHVGSIPIVSHSAPQLLALAASASPRTLISFDPNVRLSVEPEAGKWQKAVDQFRRLAHLIKVSEEDLACLYGAAADIDSIAACWLEHRCAMVIVTRGSRGATYYSRTAGNIHIEALPVSIGDTVGAGDSFQAAMLAWLWEQRRASPAEIAGLSARQIQSLGTFAAHAAAETCRHKGPEFPYRKALPASG